MFHMKRASTRACVDEGDGIAGARIVLFSPLHTHTFFLLGSEGAKVCVYISEDLRANYCILCPRVCVCACNILSNYPLSRLLQAFFPLASYPLLSPLILSPILIATRANEKNDPPAVEPVKVFIISSPVRTWWWWWCAK